MTQKRVYSAALGEQVVRAVDLARGIGLDEEEISLIARSDIELQAIPDEFKSAQTDMLPAAARGAGYGAVAGTLAGLAAAVFPPLGLTLAGAMLGGGAAGAVVGSWASALVGSSLPDPVRRQFEAEIEAGRILVVIDADEEQQAQLAPGFAEIGLTRLEYEDSISAVPED
jgi:hypothetical protein